MTDDIPSILHSSLFQRVPEIAADLIRGGMDPHAAITQAIGLAKDREDELCLLLIAPQSAVQTEAADAIRAAMCARVYARLRAAPHEPHPVNPQWAACVAALGREPEGWEFINWIAAQKGKGSP